MNGTRNTGAADSPDLCGPVFPFLNVVDLDEARVRAPRRSARRCCWASRRGQGGFRGGAGDVNDARQRLHQLPADRQTVPGYRLPRSARRLRRPVARRRRCTRSPRSLTPPVVPGLLLAVLPAGLAVRGQRNLELVVAQLPLVGIIKMLPTGFLSAETAPKTCVFLPPPRLKPPHCGQVGARQLFGHEKRGAEPFQVPRPAIGRRA